MRIDAHSHGIHAERDARGVLRLPITVGWKPADGAPDELIRQHRARGVEQAVVLDPPEFTFELQRLFGDFVIPVPHIRMDESGPEEIHKLCDRGARGIKFIAPLHSYGDERYFPLYRALRDRNAPAIFHTGYLCHEMFEPGYILERPACIDMTNMRPAAVDRVARAFPELKILMAHFGNPWWDETWELLHCNKNMYADFSGGSAFLKSMTMWREMFAPNGALHVPTVKKLCFASDDTHFFKDSFNYVKIIDFYERLYAELKLPGELREIIDRENILMLLDPRRTRL